MGFLSTLGKIAGIAAPVVAAPFTGGTSLLGLMGMGAKTAGLVGAGLGAAGKIAGGAANQRSVDRGAQAEYDVARIPTQNAQALQFANARMGADQSRMRQMAGADMLGSMKAPTDPRAKFGNSSQVSPEVIAMMRERAMQALESGSDVPQMQTMEAKPGGGPTGMDSFLRTLSGVGTGLGALQEFQRQQPQPVNPELNAANDERINQIYGKVRFF